MRKGKLQSQKVFSQECKKMSKISTSKNLPNNFSQELQHKDLR